MPLLASGPRHIRDSGRKGYVNVVLEPELLGKLIHEKVKKITSCRDASG